MVLSSNIYGYSTAISDFSVNIVDVENARLVGIDDGWGTFERTRDLQVSRNKKRAAFRWIYIIVVLLILFSGIMLVLKQKFDYIIIDALMVIVLSVGIIYIMVLYLDITNRSPTDYDKIRPDALANIKPDESNAAEIYGIDGGTPEICVGEACCYSDMSWNDKIKQCVPGPITEGFSCMGYDPMKVYTSYT